MLKSEFLNILFVTIYNTFMYILNLMTECTISGNFFKG